MSKISIIGGITADIEGHPYHQLINGDSNPGTITMSFGGVGRNITENLARIGVPVTFISVAGEDFAGKGAVRELQELGVDVEKIKLLPDENTAVYMSILNIIGDMEMGLCNMDILEKMSVDLIDEVTGHIKNSKMIGIDTNLTEEALDYATQRLQGIPLFLDPVSAAKAERAKKIIGRFHTIKPNRMEAEVLSGMNILSEEELEKASQWFIDQGVKQVFITLSGGGVYYKDSTQSGVIRPEPVKIVSVTGAGDAFSAAILYSFDRDFDIRTTAEYGMAAASITMESKSAVNKEISEKQITKRLKKQVI